MPNTLFPIDPPRAASQPKTDRLILARFLKDAATDKRFDDAELKKAHAIMVKWADLESSGRLVKMKESQMHGIFFGYTQ